MDILAYVIGLLCGLPIALVVLNVYRVKTIRDVERYFIKESNFLKLVAENYPAFNQLLKDWEKVMKLL